MPAAPTDRSPPTPRIWAIVPAAGSGSRAGGGAGAAPKQHRHIAGHSLLHHTLRALVQVDAIAQVLVVLAPDDAHAATLALAPFGSHVRSQAVGGASRAQSVRNGVAALLAQGADAGDWVLVHDAARCLVTPALVQRLIAACTPDAVGGLLALPLPDTLKQQRPEPAPPHAESPAKSSTPTGAQAPAARAACTIARGDKWLAHTPQMFRLGLLQAALAGDLEGITDEASAIEQIGHQPLLVPSSAQNFKVTYPEDFALAEAVLQARQAAARAEPADSNHPLA